MSGYRYHYHCQNCEDLRDYIGHLTRRRLGYDGSFEMDFLLPDETVHAAGDGSTDAIIETAYGPVRARVGQTFVRTPDGRVRVT